MSGWVYIISNKAMPGILKIGYTERTPYIRAYELYNTGCPYPYKVDYSIYVNKPYEVEQKAHELQRSTNVGKEWFSCSKEEAIETINNSIKICNATIENRIPSKPTQSELAEIIKLNPSATFAIEQDSINNTKPSYNPKLSINQDSTILEFSSVYIKNDYERRLTNINNDYVKRVGGLKEEYNKVINNKVSFFNFLCQVLFFGWFPYGILSVILLREILGWSQKRFESYWPNLAIIYVILSCVVAIYLMIREHKKKSKFRTLGFDIVYNEKIEECKKEKNRRIGLLITDYKRSFKII